MNIVNILFVSSFLLSVSRNIIKDLHYNVYQIEDMNQYEAKYIPEGNKFYIRFPSNLKNDITFNLTIPKDKTLFPIYSSDFPKYPDDNEIVNTDYQNELQLKTREDQEYSTYSFDIKKSDSYKVLYFRNNEVLNYLSFYAGSLGYNYGGEFLIRYKARTPVGDLAANTNYYFKVNLDPEKEKLLIEIETYYYNHAAFGLSIAFFDHSPTRDEFTVESKYGNELIYTSDYDHEYERRYYKIKNNLKAPYLVIRLENEYYLRNPEIYVGPDTSLPTWALVLIIVVAVIIVSVISFFCLRTEGGRAACCVVLGICLICCSDRRRY